MIWQRGTASVPQWCTYRQNTRLYFQKYGVDFVLPQTFGISNRRTICPTEPPPAHSPMGNFPVVSRTVRDRAVDKFLPTSQFNTEAASPSIRLTFATSFAMHCFEQNNHLINYEEIDFIRRYVIIATIAVHQSNRWAFSVKRIMYPLKSAAALG